MKKIFAMVAAPFILCFCFISGADASTLSFENFTAGSGVTVSAPYQVRTGTEYDPDTVTLTVDLSAPALTFQLTVVGSGFINGNWCELDWDDDSVGAPREDYVTLVNGGFNIQQSFNVTPSRLRRLASQGIQTVLYELETDEEPYETRDTERYLRVTFVASGSSLPNPVTPRTLSFGSFTAGSGVTASAYQAKTGTQYDPDTVTLTVDLSAPALTFQLTAAGTGFTNGNWCELDWNDGGIGAPYEQYVTPSNGSFSAVQNFTLSTARLNLASGGTRVVNYELEVDEEPYEDLGDVERHLQITFVASGSSPVNPPAPVVTRALSFESFTAGSGVTVSSPYQPRTGTEYDPDTVTLTVDLSAPTLAFQLTAAGTGFTDGSRVELDWDDGSIGAPYEQYVTPSNGSFSAVQTFSLSTARLNLANVGTRSIFYELEADEEPYGSRDTERHLRITFVASGWNSNPNPTNPGGTGGDSGGGGCNVMGMELAALGGLIAVLRRHKKTLK